MWQCMDCINRANCWTFNSCDRYEEDKTISPEEKKQIEDTWEVLYHNLAMKKITTLPDGSTITIGFGAFM